MQLSVTEREQLYAILEKYDQNPKVQQMREFIQHGDVTTYQHCKNVVLVSCWLISAANPPPASGRRRDLAGCRCFPARFLPV